MPRGIAWKREHREIRSDPNVKPCRADGDRCVCSLAAISTTACGLRRRNKDNCCFCYMPVSPSPSDAQLTELSSPFISLTFPRLTGRMNASPRCWWKPSCGSGQKKGEWGFQSRLSPPSPGRRRKHVVKGDSLKRNIRIYDDSSLSA